MSKLASQKVFCIGLHKTGTTSIHHFFKAHGLRSLHSPSWNKWSKQKRKRKFERYDCFSDGNGHDYKWLYSQYPDAKFILTTRSLRRWLISRHMHRQRRKTQFFYRLLIPLGIKGKRSITNDEESVLRWINTWKSQPQRIRDFFENKSGQLLEIDITSGKAQENCAMLEDFLGLPRKVSEFPSRNNTSKRYLEYSTTKVDAVLKKSSHLSRTI